MKIAVIGLGSMGRRRIRLIQKYNKNYIIIGVDKSLERCQMAADQFGIKTHHNLEEILNDKKPDCAFVCTSPLGHNRIINLCLTHGLHVFTELNLVDDGYDDNVALASKKRTVLFLSSTFLYREEIQYIKDKVSDSKKLMNYSYHIGQYLPDWHPWENYMDFFVGDKRTNGCREIFAVELPWIVDTFGKVENVQVLKGKHGELNIDYPDNYMVLLEHQTGHKGVLCVDVVSRKAVRNLEVYGSNLYISWNGSPEGLFHYNYDDKFDENIRLYEEIDRLDGYSSQVIENVYYKEVESFFNEIFGVSCSKYSFEKDKEILALIDRIEGK